MTSGRNSRAASAPAPRRWSDDPWSALTTGEAEAWRAGYEAARAQAVTLARRVPIPCQCSPAEAHGRMTGSLDAALAIAAMEPA